MTILILITILVTIVIDFDKIITIIMMIIKDVRKASECFRLLTP